MRRRRLLGPAGAAELSEEAGEIGGVESGNAERVVETHNCVSSLLMLLSMRSYGRSDVSFNDETQLCVSTALHHAGSAEGQHLGGRGRGRHALVQEVEQAGRE